MVTEVREVELAGVVVEARQPAFDPPAEPRENLATQRMPGHEVRVVLQQCGHDVVAVSEIGEKRIHHRVDRLSRAPVRRYVAPTRALSHAAMVSYEASNHSVVR